MTIRWFYSQSGILNGPFSDEEIKGLVVRRILLEGDLVWPEGREQKDAAPASALFDFTPSPSASSPLPDWLPDVAQIESKGPLPDPSPSNEIPDWLDDLRLWVGLEAFTSSAMLPMTAPLEVAPASAETKSASPRPANSLAERALELTGFNLETGQILDPEKFRKWKRQQAQSSPAINATLLEVFRKARIAIEGDFSITRWLTICAGERFQTVVRMWIG